MILIDEAAAAGLAAKASKSGVSIDTLKKVYRRGVAAWNSGHRPGTTPQQWGMARVNSYITKGKGTYHGADKDLREASAPKDPESGLPKKYVAGLSPSTAKARAARFNKANKLSDRNPAAYKLAPGDKMSKTKESIHTKKFRQMFGEAKDAREYGYEGDMAMSQLKAIMQHAEQLHDLLEPDTDLPEWVQSKITLAYDYIQTAADYMATELDEEALEEAYSKDVSKMHDAHFVKQTPAVQNRLNNHLRNGLSYPQAVEKARSTMGFDKGPTALNEPLPKIAQKHREQAAASIEKSYPKHPKTAPVAASIRAGKSDEHPAVQRAAFYEEAELQELSKGKIADYLDKSQSGRQHATAEKFRKSAKMATIAAKKIGKRFPGSGQMSVKVKATNEEMSPQEAYRRKHGFYSYALKAPTPAEAIGHAMNTITAKYEKAKPAKRTAGSVKEEALAEVSSDLANRAANKAYQASHRAYDDVEDLNRSIRNAEKRKNFDKADELNDKAYSLMSKVTKKERQGDKFSKYAVSKTGVKEEAAANCAGGGNVAGIGVGPDGEPGVGKRKKNPVIANMLKRRSALNVIGGGKQGQ